MEQHGRYAPKSRQFAVKFYLVAAPTGALRWTRCS